MRGAAVEKATSVASHHPAATGAALMEGDFDSFALPHAIATADRARLLETVETVREVFDPVTGQVRATGVTRLDRRAGSVLFDGSGHVHYGPVPPSRRRDGGLVKPHRASLRAEVRHDVRRRVARSRHAMTRGPRHSRAPLCTGSVAPEARQIEFLGQPAAAVFQATLDDVTRAFLTSDANLLLERIQLPVSMQKRGGNILFRTPDDLRADLECHAIEFRVRGVTDMVRSVKTVELVGARRMHGTYRTHVLRGNDLLIPSYVSAVTLEPGDDLQWRRTSVMHPIGHLTARRVLLGKEE